MHILAALLLACRPPDPDAALRSGELPAAAAAYERAHKTPLDIDHPVADILAARARRDPTVTTASIADAVAAARFLEQAPRQNTQSLDLTFDTFVDLFAALEALAEPPYLVAVGRSENLADRDPYVTPGAPLPWKGGRIVGWGRGALGPLAAAIEADPPAKLVVLGVGDASGNLYVNLERRDGVWMAIGASDANAAARLILAADAVRDYGGPALRAREGGGFVRR